MIRLKIKLMFNNGYSKNNIAVTIIKNLSSLEIIEIPFIAIIEAAIIIPCAIGIDKKLQLNPTDERKNKIK